MSQANSNGTDPDIEVINLKTATYHLRRHTLGEDYLAIQDAATSTDADGNIEFNRRTYELANLRIRLRTPDGESFTDEQLLKLPRAHFQILSMSAVRLETAESEESSDFLAEFFPEAESPSSSETSSSSPLVTSEA